MVGNVSRKSETINSIKYLQILQECLLPEMFLGEKLQQDNAPAHNLILSKTWFSEKALEILENWPPNSPDINIIGNVCSLLKKSFPKTSLNYWGTLSLLSRRIRNNTFGVHSKLI